MSLPFYYKNAPVFIQNILLNFKGYLIERTRFNKDFKIFLNEFEKNNYKEIDEIQLQKFLISASKTKFWSERFYKFEVDVNEKDLIKEIKKLPILTKEEVIKNVEHIKNSNLDIPINIVKTSGTTGTNLTFTQTQLSENKQWAVWWRYRKRLGIDRNTWCGWLAGKEIISLEQNTPPYWRYNRPGKQLMFSAYHLKKETATDYFQTLKKKNITWIHGFPSQIALLATYVEELELGNLPSLKIITYGSENMFEHQKILIERVFKVPIRTHYGLSEGVANISQMPDGSFEVDQDFAFTEFIPLEEEENQHRIIGTNYWNEAFPLIRYDTSDLAHIKENNYSKELIRIDGRADDYIIRPDGVKIARLGYLFSGQNDVKEAQIYQPSKKEVVFRIVPRSSYVKSKSEKEILDAARSRLGNDINFSFQYLKEIPKTHANKLKYVISDVK